VSVAEPTPVLVSEQRELNRSTFAGQRWALRGSLLLFWFIAALTLVLFIVALPEILVRTISLTYEIGLLMFVILVICMVRPTLRAVGLRRLGADHVRVTPEALELILRYGAQYAIRWRDPHLRFRLLDFSTPPAGVDPGSSTFEIRTGYRASILAKGRLRQSS
jgi:hypothetical protein